MTDSALTTAIRAYIARVGVEVAHATFTAGPPTGGKPLSLARVQRVADGKDEPTYRMAEIVHEDEMRKAARPALPVETVSGPVPAPMQPWEVPAVAHQGTPRQPWE